MGYERKSIPALPCPYCLAVRNIDPAMAVGLGSNGTDPKSAKSELELHMTECDRKDDPITDGFVQASELLGRTSAGLGLSEPRDDPKDITEVLEPCG